MDELHQFACTKCHFVFVHRLGPVRCVRCGHNYVWDHGSIAVGNDEGGKKGQLADVVPHTQ